MADVPTVSSGPARWPMFPPGNLGQIRRARVELLLHIATRERANKLNLTTAVQASWPRVSNKKVNLAVRGGDHRGVDTPKVDGGYQSFNTVQRIR